MRFLFVAYIDGKIQTIRRESTSTWSLPQLPNSNAMSDLSSRDTALFNTVKAKLNTALMGDVLDTMGYQAQFLPPTLRPLDLSSKIVGRAMPVLEAEYRSSGVAADHQGPLGNHSFGLMMEALDSLQPNEIYIASSSSFGAAPAFAFWGGLMSTRASYLKAAGAIVNGYSRDTDEILRLGFPVWSVGLYSQASPL